MIESSRTTDIVVRSIQELVSRGKGATMDQQQHRPPRPAQSGAQAGAILSIRLDAPTVRVLQELARSTGLSPAQLVQAWVRERARREHSRIPA
jgi:hypothetical protein